MALSAGTVSIGVKPDTTGFGAKLKEDVIGGSAGIGEGLGKSLLTGLGAIGVAAGLGEMFKSGMDKVMAESAGNAQLAAGIKSTGDAANVTVQGMNALSSSIQGYSGQTAESITKAQQLLLTFTGIKNVGPDKIFDQATEAAANMAAKMGGDASSNAILLGKALNDPEKGITALTRVGVSFTDQQKAQIKAMQDSGDTMGAQKIILGELNTEFGGAAQAYGDSLPGQIARTKLAFGELTKVMAEMLLPILEPILQGFLKLFTAVQPAVEAFGEKFQEFLKDIGENAKGPLDSIMGAFKQLAPTFQSLVPQLMSLMSAFSPMGLLFKSLEPLLPTIVKAVTDLAVTIGQALGQALSVILPPLMDLVKILTGELSSIFKALVPMIMDLVSSFGTYLAGVIKDIAPLIATVIQILMTLAKEVLVPLLPAVMDVVKAVMSLAQALMPLILAILPPVIALLQALMPIIMPLASFLVDVLVIAIQLVSAVLTTLIGWITKIIGWFTNLVDAVVTAGKNIGKWFQDLPSMIQGFLTSAGTWLLDAGKNIIQGLIDGANSMWSAVQGWLNDLGGKIVNGFKSLLGIHSPSTVFHDFGVNIGEGLANGINEGSANAVTAITKMGKAVTSSFTDGTGITVNTDGTYSIGSGVIAGVTTAGQDLVAAANGQSLDVGAMTAAYNAQWEAIQRAHPGMMMDQAMAAADKANGGSLQARLDSALGNTTVQNAAGVTVNMSAGTSSNLISAYNNAGFQTQAAGGTVINYYAAPNDSITSEQKLTDAVIKAPYIAPSLL